ncbi:unnamed protein product [Tetraodon nigroviridis]|uniref:(spotted green pufferfish) hypothetical protein n=1 Tax=Tetraodon nigroviridis TaxID=99883 RepID=Q4TBZ7_TETNG|nr:unnamed protein product [Tetraodon nigroviridis]
MRHSPGARTGARPQHDAAFRRASPPGRQAHPAGAAGPAAANHSLSPVRHKLSQQTLLLGKGLRGSGPDQVLLRAQMTATSTQHHGNGEPEHAQPPSLRPTSKPRLHSPNGHRLSSPRQSSAFQPMAASLSGKPAGGPKACPPSHGVLGGGPSQRASLPVNSLPDFERVPSAARQLQIIALSSGRQAQAGANSHALQPPPHLPESAEPPCQKKKKTSGAEDGPHPPPDGPKPTWPPFSPRPPSSARRPLRKHKRPRASASRRRSFLGRETGGASRKSRRRSQMMAESRRTKGAWSA